jgi:hypothetical protein
MVKKWKKTKYCEFVVVVNGDDDDRMLAKIVECNILLLLPLLMMMLLLCKRIERCYIKIDWILFELRSYVKITSRF